MRIILYGAASSHCTVRQRTDRAARPYHNPRTVSSVVYQYYTATQYYYLPIRYLFATHTPLALSITKHFVSQSTTHHKVNCNRRVPRFKEGSNRQAVGTSPQGKRATGHDCRERAKPSGVKGLWNFSGIFVKEKSSSFSCKGRPKILQFSAGQDRLRFVNEGALAPGG